MADGEEGGEEEAATGIAAEAAVDGLMSCEGEGACLREADWMVEASSTTGSWDIMIRLKLMESRRCEVRSQHAWMLLEYMKIL